MKNEIEIHKLTDKNSKYIDKITEWQYSWWGNDYSKDKVKEWIIRCVNSDKIPQTFIATENDNIIGMYQIAMDDDVDIRPDYYPWLVNVYVEENNRGRGICKLLMEDFVKQAKKLNISRAYLYTKHINLYEKYGWQFLEEVETFKSKKRRIYYLDINM